MLIMEMCFRGGWVMSEGGEHFEFDFVRAAGCWEIEMGLEKMAEDFGVHSGWDEMPC